MKDDTTNDTNHFVHFYYGTATLFDPLAKYINDGLRDGETCIVISSAKHQRALEEHLDSDLNLEALHESSQYLVFDAEDLLKSFMKSGTPDKENFAQFIGGIVAAASERGKPIRAFSEMVALVRKHGNDEAVLELENLWDALTEKFSMSVFCAYPSYYFDDTYKNTSILSRIKQAHSTVIS